MVQERSGGTNRFSTGNIKFGKAMLNVCGLRQEKHVQSPNDPEPPENSEGPQDPS